MRRAYKYRVYPTRTQGEVLHGQINEACRLYNAAIDERKSAWKMQRISIGYHQQRKQLPEIRAGGFGLVNAQASQDVLNRVDKAFDAFFRRVKAGEKQPGYPRFRSQHRYDSITFPQYQNGANIRPSGRLYLHGVGDLKVKWHRLIPDDAKIKTVTVKREAGRWYVSFSLDMPEPEPLPTRDVSVGVDLGLTTFAVLSDGVEVARERHFRLSERQLRIAQRKLSRRKKRSRRRLKARQEVARIHAHVTNQRRDFHHKTARSLVQQYGLIAIEDLNVKGLAGAMLAKSVHDAGWGQFISILSAKAEEAGRTLVKVNPAGTTQRCSSCGGYVPKRLGDRWHKCACGLNIGRDLNAARNILHLATGPGWGLQARTVGRYPIGASHAVA